MSCMRDGRIDRNSKILTYEYVPKYSPCGSCFQVRHIIGEIPKYGVRIQDPFGSTVIITWSYIIILVNKLITSIN